MKRRLWTVVVGIAFGGFATAGFAQSNPCSNQTAKFEKPLDGPHWTGWGVTPSQQRSQPANMARLSASDSAKLQLKWAFGFPDVNQRASLQSQAVESLLEAPRRKCMRSMRRPDAFIGLLRRMLRFARQ